MAAPDKVSPGRMNSFFISTVSWSSAISRSRESAFSAAIRQENFSRSSGAVACLGAENQEVFLDPGDDFPGFSLGGGGFGETEGRGRFIQRSVGLVAAGLGARAMSW
jgi:hypothetical protein